MEAWYYEAKKALWASPADVKSQYGSASLIGDNRVVFNIAGNKYRLIVRINYDSKTVFVRFVGTHKEYDKINAEVIQMVSRLIKTDEDYERALSRIDGLMNAKPGTIEMVKRCWIPKAKDLKENAEELMRNFISLAGGFETVSIALFRQGKSARYNSKMDPYALTAWCIRVLSIAKKNPLKNEYVKGTIKQKTMQEIARLSYFDNGPLLAKEYIEKQGIHLIIVPHLPRTYLDGAAMLMPDGTPVIGLTLRYDRIDNFWFCLLHEIAHVARHLTASDQIIIDDLDLRGHDVPLDDRVEKEADDMTLAGLIPKKVWQKNQIRGKVTTRKVYDLAEELKIHPAIIAGRVRYERNNYKLLSRHVGSKQVRKHFAQICSEATAC